MSDQPLDWLTVEEVAQYCKRQPGTIRNLISKFQLPVARRWIVRNRLRRRTMLISPATARYLQRITLDGEEASKTQRPGRALPCK